MNTIRRFISVLALAAIWSQASLASTSAATDCQIATADGERAICSDEQLVDQDKELGKVFRQLLNRRPASAQTLRVEQRRWLRQRDQCGADKSCLATVYSARLEQLRSRITYAPDGTDWRAAKDLRDEVILQSKRSPEWALESALERYKVRGGVTQFFNVEGDETASDGAMFPTRQPAGVREDEWGALQRGHFVPEGENGMGSYTLADLDGDGRRDLVVATYLGGTGLFESISVYRRVGNGFAGFGDSPENGDEHFVYLTNGRGANQYGEWLQLHGRRYLAYVEGSYGRDHVTLLRPFELNQRAIGFDVVYTYALSLPRIQKRDGESPVEIPEATWSVLSQAVLRLSERATEPEQDSDAQVCPPSPGLGAEQAEEYGRFGPGHYSYEIIADVPVQLDGACHPARLLDWFGHYRKDDGLAAALWVQRADNEGGVDEFEVTGTRKTVHVNDLYLSDAPTSL